MLKVEEEIMTPGDDHHHPGLFSSFGSVDLSFFCFSSAGSGLLSCPSHDIMTHL